MLHPSVSALVAQVDQGEAVQSISFMQGEVKVYSDPLEI